MDLISHGLMGTMLAGLGIRKKFGLASTAVMFIASIAPDLDIVAGIKGPKTFYKYHREITHSLMGASILWVLISAGVYLFTPLHNLAAVAIMVGLGLAGHMLVDSLTPWGLPLFYPFTDKKYSFDLIWFFDPVLIATMIGGVYLLYQYQAFQTLISLMSFAILGGYLVLRVINKRKGLKMAEVELTPRYKDAEVYVLPSAISPFLWDVIYKARSQYLYICVDTRKEQVLTVREFTSSPYHRCVKSSYESDLVDIFLKRSRFPFYTVNKVDTGFLVEWSDAQLLNLGGVHGVKVRLDEAGRITGQKLQIKKPVRRRKRKIEDYLQEEAS